MEKLPDHLIFDTQAQRSLPIAALDMQHFMSGTTNEKLQFVAELGKSFSEIGFAAVTDSGNALVSADMQQRLFSEVAAFFALPDAVKLRYVVPHANGQRGYNRFLSEQAKDGVTPDLKEFWHHGQSHAADDPLKEKDFENVIVNERPLFTTTLEETYRALEKTSQCLLQAIALYLDLPQAYFDQYVQGGLSILRAIHYPPITSEPQSAIRAAAHEDINLITLLMGASSSGLEVLRKDGQWIPLLVPSGYLTLNVGDMLQRLTNKKMVSTTHRVVNPPKNEWHKPRYSVPFFSHPRPEMSLACLPSCVSSTHPKIFSDMTAKEYLAERLREIRR